MTALPAVRFADLDERDALCSGGDLSVVIVAAASVESTASRVLRARGRGVSRIRAPSEAIELVRRARTAPGVRVVFDVEGRADAFWEALDRLRDRLLSGRSLLFVLSRQAAEMFARHAPHLASLARSMALLDPDEESAATTADNEAQAEFDRLLQAWEAGTAHHSSLTKIVRHPAYQQIIAMGERAVRPILRDLERSHRPWGPALRAITGASPEIPPEDAGRASQIAAAWLRWAAAEGYAW